MLDTSAYANLFRGDEAVLTVLSEAREVYLPVTVIGELLAGFRMGSQEKKNRGEPQEFLSKPTVKISETTFEVADVYAHLIRDLRALGKKIPTNDLWIASATISLGAVLVSDDGHFEDLPGLRCWK